MDNTLRERAAHGDRSFPFALYNIERITQPWSFSLHWHDEVEVIYVRQGTLHLTVERKPFVGHAGDVFIVNSREVHGMRVEETPTIVAAFLFPLSSLLFRWDEDIVEEYLRPLAENERRFTNDLTGLQCLPKLRSKLETIMELYRQKSDCYKLKIRTLQLGILCNLLTEDGALQPAQSPYFRQKHRQVLGYINEHYQNDLSLESIAEHFHMAPKYFSRYFKVNFHISLTEYINHFRLEKAADLLRHTELSVTEIALQVGFNSSSYFNKQFRSTYEMTPSQYRTQWESRGF